MRVDDTVETRDEGSARVSSLADGHKRAAAWTRYADLGFSLIVPWLRAAQAEWNRQQRGTATLS